MKKIVSIATTALLLTFCASTQADIVQKSVVDFSGVQEMLNDINKAEKTVLILDFQGTTSMLSCDYQKPTAESCPYLGSKSWFDWQLSLLEGESDSDYLIAKDKAELIEISNVFLETALMEYTEESIPKIIDTFSKNNVRIMFVTQYGSMHRLVESKAVLMPLNEKEKTSLADVMSLGSPQLNEPLTALSVCNSTEKAKVNYQNGILYTAGENVIGAVQCFLDQYNAQLSELAKQEGSEKTKLKEARKVVYVSDSYQDVAELYDVYRGNNDYDIFSLHYTKSEQLWKPLLADGKEVELQIAAHKKWLEIKEDVFKKVYLEDLED